MKKKKIRKRSNIQFYWMRNKNKEKILTNDQRKKNKEMNVHRKERIIKKWMFKEKEEK